MRHPKLKDRSYRTFNWGTSMGHIPSTEVAEHVLNTCRMDADPVFNELAKNAAISGIRNGYTGRQGVAFTQPTTAAKGYFSVLKYIVKNPGASHRKLRAHFKSPLPTTLTRLCSGQLIKTAIERDPETRRLSYHYYATPAGIAFARVGEQYLVKRTVTKKFF